MDDTSNFIDKFEAFFQQLTEARVYVNHTFPDLRSRQAFLGAMVISMCEEFHVDINELFDSWKEVL